ncbi:MAG: NAD(P)H-hydrate dehydratase [Acidobacteriota bacterium]
MSAALVLYLAILEKRNGWCSGRQRAASAAVFCFAPKYPPKTSVPERGIDPTKTRPYHPAVQRVISAEQMGKIDHLTVQGYEVSSQQLMQNAAKACFQEIKSFFSGNLARKKALVLCGQGNNGGDGAALAQELCHVGFEVDVVLFGRVQDSKDDARTSFEIVRSLADSEDVGSPKSLSFVECNCDSEWEEVNSSHGYYDLIIDALFGTGLSRPLGGVFLSVINYLTRIRSTNEGASPPLIVSVDIPSGLNADLPNPFGPAVHADLTVTFTAPKAANVLPPASHFNGKLVVADIGSPKELIESVGSNLFVVEPNDVREWLFRTRYTSGSYKNTHGHVLVIAGSRGYTGAAVLCGNAAMRSGAGLVTIATPSSAQALVAATAMTEVMTAPLAETDRGAVSDDAIHHVKRLAAKSSVIAIGPGLSAEDDRTRRFVYSIVRQRNTPMVIDADGLNCLAPWPTDLQGSEEAPLVLTPHPGEMLRLIGAHDKSVLNDRVALARDFATRHNLILVLKGTRSLVAAPDGRVFINPTGNAGLGTAGSGDTLTGIIAGFVAQAVATLRENADALVATIAALYIGGLAGDLAAKDLGMRTMVASDIRNHFSNAVRLLDPTGERP